MKNELRRFLLITFGVFLVSLGIYYLWIPATVAPGGVTSIMVVVQTIFPNLDVSQSITAINVVLVIIGFIVFGRGFGGYTTYSSLLLSGLTILYENVFPLKEPLVDSILLATIFGGVVVGIGLGIVFNENASTGGTDIIAKIVTKFSALQISKSVFVTDAFFTIIAISQIGIEKGLYSIIGIYASTVAMEMATEGIKNKIELKIISNKFDEINTYLNKEIGRGTTIFMAEGGFSSNEKKMIYTVLSRSEYIKAREYIEMTDPSAFVIISSVNEVVGEGFSFQKLL